MRPGMLVGLVAAAASKLGAAPYEPLHPLAIAGAGGVGRAAVEPGRVAARLESFLAAAAALRGVHEELARRAEGLPHRLATAVAVPAAAPPGHAPRESGAPPTAAATDDFAWSTGRGGRRGRSRSRSGSRSRSRSRSRERGFATRGAGGGPHQQHPHPHRHAPAGHASSGYQYPTSWAAAIERHAAAAGYAGGAGPGGTPAPPPPVADAAGGRAASAATVGAAGAEREAAAAWGGGRLSEFAGLGFS